MIEGRYTYREIRELMDKWVGKYDENVYRLMCSIFGKLETKEEILKLHLGESVYADWVVATSDNIEGNLLDGVEFYAQQEVRAARVKWELEKSGEK